MTQIRYLAAALAALACIPRANAQFMPGQEIPAGVSYSPAPGSTMLTAPRIPAPVSPLAAIAAPPVAARTAVFGVPAAAEPAPMQMAPAAPAGAAAADATASGQGSHPAMTAPAPAAGTQPAAATPAGADALRPGERLAGHPRVLAGDTLQIEGHRIALRGIVAPRPGQQCYLAPGNWGCGDASTAALELLVSRGPVVCTVLADTAPSSAPSASCRLGRDDLSAAMAETGMVKPSGLDRDLRHASDDARADRRGLWAAMPQ